MGRVAFWPVLLLWRERVEIYLARNGVSGRKYGLVRPVKACWSAGSPGFCESQQLVFFNFDIQPSPLIVSQDAPRACDSVVWFIEGRLLSQRTEMAG